jgi:hypothetical protein
VNDYVDINRALMLDANAVGGLLQEIFAVEMTVSPAECAHCGHAGPIGSLLAFVRGSGIVLRCPVCENIVLRVARTPDRMYVDARGAAYFCVPSAAQ